MSENWGKISVFGPEKFSVPRVLLDPLMHDCNFCSHYPLHPVNVIRINIETAPKSKVKYTWYKYVDLSQIYLFHMKSNKHFASSRQNVWKKFKILAKVCHFYFFWFPLCMDRYICKICWFNIFYWKWTLREKNELKNYFLFFQLLKGLKKKFQLSAQSYLCWRCI